MRNALIVISLTTFCLFSCSRNKETGINPGRGSGGTSGAATVKDYPVLTLVPMSVTVHQDFPAVIEGQRVIEIRPMISGYLKEIHVDEGQKVKKGQLLFIINNPQYEQDVITAKARINSAVADVNTARMEIEKVRPLVEKEIVSNYRLQSAELTLEAREAALEQAKAALRNAETNLSYTIIRSPQDGIIGTIPYKNGALVGSNSAEALTTLSDINEVFAYFSWNEKQVLDILSGSRGVLIEEKIKNLPPATLILSNSSEYPLKGRLEMASGLIATETGSATLKAIFKNPDGLIRSGSSARIRIPRNYDSVLVVPQSATYELQDKRFIYTVNPENKVIAVTIGSIPTDDGKYFIASSGLKPGDRIVTEGVISLKDGNTIIPKDTSAVTFYGQLF
jgi:membrane fusion protein (multidrug efflux system)